MICLVLVDSHLFPLPCGASSTVPREGFYFSVIILESLLVFLMLGCCHSLLRHCNISCFSQVECTFSTIPTCVHLQVGGTLPCAFGVKGPGTALIAIKPFKCTQMKIIYKHIVFPNFDFIYFPHK